MGRLTAVNIIENKIVNLREDIKRYDKAGGLEALVNKALIQIDAFQDAIIIINENS